MSQVLFYSVTAAQYAAITTKDPNALYFLTDANRLYKGDVPFSHPVEVVSDFPANGEVGTLYVKSGTYEARVRNGASWATVSLPVTGTVGSSPSDNEIATAKAVKEYVDNQIINVNTGLSGAITDVSYVPSSKSLSVKTGSASPVVTALSGLFDDVSYDGATGVLTFATNGGTPKTVNLPVENFLSAASFDDSTSILTLTLTNGSTVTVSLADLIDVYTGGSSPTAEVSVSGGVVTANAKVSADSGNLLSAKADGLYAGLQWQTIVQ